MRNFFIVHAVLFITIALITPDPWPSLLLTAAQIVYVPTMLKMLLPSDWFMKWYPFLAGPAYLSVAAVPFLDSWALWIPATVYFLFTLVIAWLGLRRFLQRGFTNIEEFAIDAGMMYLAMGGAWYFAYLIGMDTGFTPLLTWLTAIHFHYSAFLLPIFIGFAARTRKPARFAAVAAILLIAPLVTAIGITFSRYIELFSVLLYIAGLAGINLMAWKIPLQGIQKWLIRLSFGSLAITILFSLLYVLGNSFGLLRMTIDDMLMLHGFLNCVVFALCGVIGWAVSTPPPVYRPQAFPVSRIRGKQTADRLGKPGSGRGLVDDMAIYRLEKLHPAISDFYENTTGYRLFATVRWHAWFKPFAHIYSLISRRTEQINLPTHGRQVEMTGDVVMLPDNLDHRELVRAWLRKVDDRYAFIALYSYHHDAAGTPYMNIALPLPFMTMTGILELRDLPDGLLLTSVRTDQDSDAGVYMSGKRGHLFKLPLSERFVVKVSDDGSLEASHRMKIFAIPFLSIKYRIVKK